MTEFDSRGLGADDGRSGDTSLGLAMAAGLMPAGLMPAGLMPAGLMPADIMRDDIMPDDFRHSVVAAVPAILVTNS